MLPWHCAPSTALGVRLNAPFSGSQGPLRLATVTEPSCEGMYGLHHDPFDKSIPRQQASTSEVLP